MKRDTEILKAELAAIAFVDRNLIYQDSISVLDHLSYDLRKERKLEIEEELRRREKLCERNEISSRIDIPSPAAVDKPSLAHPQTTPSLSEEPQR